MDVVADSPLLLPKSRPSRLGLKQRDGSIASTESSMKMDDVADSPILRPKSRPSRLSLKQRDGSIVGGGNESSEKMDVADSLLLRPKSRLTRLSLEQRHGSIATTESSSSSFFLMITGQIECAQTSSYPLVNTQLYCRYTYSQGPDWVVTHGMTQGITQIAGSRRALKGNDEEGKGSVVVWNFPIDISFQSTNTHGWPRICFSVYGKDFLGRDVLRGCASMLLPINPEGRHTKFVKMYRPVSGNVLQQFISWLTATQPEYHDTKITARGEGRALTRVVNESNLTLKINLVTTRKDFQSFGYTSK